MPAHFHRLGRGFLAILRLGTTWIPSALMVVLGSGYLFECGHALLAPGVPFTTSYLDSAGKTVRVTAQTYAYDPGRMLLTLNRLKMTEAGALVGSVASLQADLSGPSPRVFARGIVANVRRGPDGTLSAIGLAPKPVPGEPKPAFEAEIHDISVDLVDTSRSPGLITPIQASLIRFSSADGATVAMADLQLAQSKEKLAVRVATGADQGWAAEANFDHTDLGKLLPELSRWLPADPAWADLKSASGTLIATGDLRASSRLRGMPEGSGRLSLDGSNLSYGNAFKQASLHLDLDGSGPTCRTVGHLSQGGLTVSIDGVGVVLSKTWSGFVRASLPNPSASIFKLPPGASFQSAGFDGWASWDGKAAQATGSLRLGSLAFQGQSVTGVAATAAMSGNVVTIGFSQAVYRSLHLSGALSLDTKSNRLAGYVDLPPQNLDKYLKEAGLSQAAATGSARVLVSGPTNALAISLDAKGRLVYKGKPLGDFELRAASAGPNWHIQSGLLTGPAGAVAVSGTADTAHGELDLEAKGAALALAPWVDGVTGTGFFGGKIVGTFKDPVLDGHLDVYDLKKGDISVPRVSADILADRQTVEVPQAVARVAGGRATMRGRYGLADQSVSASFRADSLMLSTMTDQPVEGRLDVSDGTVTGTLSHPVVSAKFRTGNVIAESVHIDQASGVILGQGDSYRLVGLRVEAEKGNLTGEAEYDPQTRSGTATLDLSQVPLEAWQPADEPVSLKGLLSGRAVVTFKDKHAPAASFAGKLDGLVAAGLAIGSGDVQADFDGSLAHANALVGSVDRYIDLSSLSYDPEKQVVSLSATFDNIDLHDVATSLEQSNLNLNDDQLSLMDRVSGSVGATIHAEGPVSKPDVTVSGLTTDKLRLGEAKLGKIKASATEKAGRWDYDFSWLGDSFSLTSAGKVEEHGAIDAQASLVKFDLSLLSVVFPEVPRIGGHATMTVVASGKTEDPDARASLLVQDLQYQNAHGQMADLPITAELGDISYHHRSATGTGAVSYKDLSARFTGTLPFDALADKPTAQYEATLTFDRRSLSSLEEFLPWMDPTATDAEIEGRLHVSGDKAAFALDGSMDVGGKGKLKLKNSDQEFTDLVAKLGLAKDNASLVVSARQGAGLLALNLDATSPGGFSPDQFLDQTTLKGSLKVDRVKVKAALPGTSKTSESEATGELDVSGAARTPHIGGGLVLDGATVVLPDEFPDSAPGAAPVIDPVFDNVTLTATKGTSVRAAAGSVRLFGTGTLSGNLTDPEFRAPLTVQDGSFQLPTRKVNLEPGSILLTYNGIPRKPHADLDLTATTTATKQVATGQYQTYVINLSMKGDLLAQNGLRVSGTSDPPDLTNDDIMSLVGEQSLIEGLGASLTSGQDKGQLRDTLYSIAVPNLTSSLTDSVAQGLKLDYLVLDYNPFDFAVLRGGKTVAKGLILQLSRQLAQPTSGRQKFDLSLNYQIPSKDPILSRLRVGFGVDQDNPWKISLNYSFRF